MQKKIPSLIKIKPFSIIELSIVFVCVAIIWVYQLNTVVTEAQTQILLKFEVSTPENIYLHLEPIPVDFKLSNQTTIPKVWSAYLGWGRNINLISRSENGTEIRWIGDNAGDSPMIERETMLPGTSTKQRNLISESLAKRLFPNPGRYELWVEYVEFYYVNQRTQIETIRANPINIHIKSPQGVNLSAYQYLLTHDLISRGESYRERAAKLQTFVNNFPASVYWKYAAFDLGYIYFELKDYEQAERELYNISDLDFYYTEKVQYLLREVNDRHFNRVNVRTKRSTVPVIPPVIGPLTVKTPVPIPFPNNPPVLIPIPNANPNATPINPRIRVNPD